MVSVKQVYTSVACNRSPEIADWNSEGLISYGATNAVVIYDMNKKGSDPLTVLSHHKSKVNSVKWLHKSDNSCTELLSCSADKTAAIWTLTNGTWVVSSVLLGHGDGVTCNNGLYIEDSLVVYTGSIDSTVRVWGRMDGTTALKQIINLHSGLCLTLQAYILPTANKPILFCALDDHKIHMFAEDNEYHRVHTLVGHEDWVRGLDTIKVDNKTIMLASASQDTYIRLWRIQQHEEEEVSVNSPIKVEEKVFQAYGVTWSVKLDAVLAGHEGWVYGVQWEKKFDNDNQPFYRLLSSSLDKTIIIWQPEIHGGAWVENVRVGEVGGNGLGFYGSRFGPDSFMGHGYNGSLHIWKLDKETNQWQPSVVVGGHFNGVEDMKWEPRGRYLVSVSLDQTTRIHAPWKRADGQGRQWHEVCRPQVHGYDLAAVALLAPAALASAAEEKVVRVFQAPHNFVVNFGNIVGEGLGVDGVKGPEGASVPSLGLSNKAVFSAKDQANGDENDGYFVPLELHEPPTEETLMQNTLWPETQKLYGHGYEVFTLAASPDGSLLASACKSSSLVHAAVIIWETKTWQQIQQLQSHTLTVTQLAFSPNSQRLLSVSRDRRWTVYKRIADSNQFHIEANTDKSNGVHSRIIWCCAWGDDGVFATGSRDGKVCVWSRTDTISDSSLKNYGLVGKPLEVPNSSVTALDFAPIKSERIIAVGFESGVIRIYGFDGVWSLLHEMDNSIAHHLTVKRLIFKPKAGEEESKEFVLASCGSDNFVRIYSLTIT